MDITIPKELVFQPNIILTIIPIAAIAMGVVASAYSLNQAWTKSWSYKEHTKHMRSAVGTLALTIALSIGFAYLSAAFVNNHKSGETAGPLDGLRGHEEMAYTVDATQKALENAGIVSSDVITIKHDFWGREFDHLDHDLADAVTNACGDRLQKPSTLRVANLVKADGTVSDGILNVVPGKDQCRVSFTEKK